MANAVDSQSILLTATRELSGGSRFSHVYGVR